MGFLTLTIGFVFFVGLHAKKAGAPEPKPWRSLLLGLGFGYAFASKLSRNNPCQAHVTFFAYRPQRTLLGHGRMALRNRRYFRCQQAEVSA